MPAYFFSDAHLGAGPAAVEKEKEERLLAFLRHIYPTCESLFIVGDLFDFWFEYKTVVPKGFHRTLAALQGFTAGGTEVHYLAGNHDFWMGDFFQTELGMTLHFEPFELSIHGRRVCLHHGDGLAKHDIGYKLIKPILRSGINVRLYRWLHPDLGIRIARRSSKTSRDYTAQKHYGEEKGMVEFARQRIAEGADYVVMGHRHRPSFVPIQHGAYVNLGDWITNNTYAEMAAGIMQLKIWDGTEGKSYGRN